MVISWYIMNYHFMPYHCIVTTCHGISYPFIIIHNTSLHDHITSWHFMSHLGISYPIMAFLSISCRIMAFHSISCHIMAFHTTSWHFIFIPYQSISHHIMAFHTIWHFIPYGISYNIIFHTTTCGISIHITYIIHMFHIISISSQTPSGLNAEPASTDAVDQAHRGLVALKEIIN